MEMLERRAMKPSRSKAECMCVNEWGRWKRKTARSGVKFKYLQSTIQIEHQRGGDRVEMRVTGDLWQKETSKTESKGLQDDNETCYDIWFGDSSTSKKKEVYAVVVDMQSVGVTQENNCHYI